MRTWSIALLLVSMTLAGCADVESPGSTPESTDSADGDGLHAGNDHGSVATDGDGNSTVNETVEDVVPVLKFGYDAINGTAPLLVNFTVDAEDDSDELYYSISMNGTEFRFNDTVPDAFNHTFEPGLWNITVTLSDGEHIVTDGFALNVTAPVVVEAPTGPIIDVVLPRLISCTQCTGGGPMASAGSYWWASGLSGTVNPSFNSMPLLGPDIALVSIPPEAQGQPYQITASGGSGAAFGNDPDAFFSTTCALANAQLEYQLGGGHYAESTGAEAGVVPADAACAWVWAWGDRATMSLRVVIG